MVSDDNKPPVAAVIRFPQSRVSPPASITPPRQLGLGAMAKIIGVPERQATGHWCSHCKGIWYGYLLEVTCPVCENRRG